MELKAENNLFTLVILMMPLQIMKRLYLLPSDGLYDRYNPDFHESKEIIANFFQNTKMVLMMQNNPNVHLGI